LNRRIGKLLILTWTVVFLLLMCVLVNFSRETNVVHRPSNEEKKLVIMAVYEEDESDEYLKKMLDEYSAIPGNPKVVTEYVAQSAFQKQLCLYKDQNSLPDLIICDSVMTPALQSMDILRDLSDYMTGERTSRFLKHAYGSCVVNGICYGVPFTSNPYVVFYNKDHLARYKKEIPDNMDDFYNLCRETKSLGTYSFGIAVRNKEDIASSFLQLVYSAGGNLRGLDSENSLKLYEILGKMRDEGIIAQDVINWNQKDLMQAFSSGYVKIAVAKLSSMSLLEHSASQINYEIAEIPYIQKQTFLFQGDMIGVTETADEAEALKLLDYMTSPEVAESYYKNTYSLSVRTDVRINPGKVRGLSDEFVERERNQSVLKSTYSTWFIISDSIAGAMSDFFGDKSMTPQAVSSRLQGEIRSAILER